MLAAEQAFLAGGAEAPRDEITFRERIASGRPRLVAAGTRLGDVFVWDLATDDGIRRSLRIDGPVLAFTVGSTLLAALVSSFMPAWTFSRASVVDALREGGRGTTDRRIGLVTRGLVVFQVAVTCVLLVGSLLQERSIRKQQTIDYGYDTVGIMSARMGLMDGDYPTPEARRLFYDRLQRELSHYPEFEAVALTSRFRMVFAGSGPIEIEGKDPKPLELKELIDHARNEGIKVIFAQPQFSDKSARLVAKEIGGQVVYADPLAEDWMSNLMAVADKFKAALK